MDTAASPATRTAASAERATAIAGKCGYDTAATAAETMAAFHAGNVVVVGEIKRVISGQRPHRRRDCADRRLTSTSARSGEQPRCRRHRRGNRSSTSSVVDSARWPPPGA